MKWASFELPPGVMGDDLLENSPIMVHLLKPSQEPQMLTFSARAVGS